LFGEIRDRVAAHATALLRSADAVADIDVLASLAEVAAVHGYVQPEITDAPVLDIRAGRHPVVERMLSGERYVPNDLHMSAADRAMLIVTGPNMAGKSTYLRQAALITLLAHKIGRASCRESVEQVDAAAPLRIKRLDSDQ